MHSTQFTNDDNISNSLYCKFHMPINSHSAFINFSFNSYVSRIPLNFNICIYYNQATPILSIYPLEIRAFFFS